MTTRVFLLDDHEIVRRGLRELLEQEDDLAVAGEASTAAEAYVRIPTCHADVALLDVRLPDGDGVDVCRELRSRQPALRCVMLTSVSDDEAMFNAIMAGAAGYLLKDVSGSELVAGVRRVARGESLLDPALTTRVLDGLWAPHRDDDELAVLTDQERKVLDLIGQGLTNREIGDRLFIAEKTVKNHASNLYAKLGMRHRSEAAAYVAGRAERRRQRET